MHRFRFLESQCMMQNIEIIILTTANIVTLLTRCLLPLILDSDLYIYMYYVFVKYTVTRNGQMIKHEYVYCYNML